MTTETGTEFVGCASCPTDPPGNGRDPAAAPMCLCFDLDGTLANPLEGIANSFAHALETLGRPSPVRQDIRPLIGPPLRFGLSRLLESTDGELIERAVEHYRDYFSETGLYENELYAGIPETLHTLGPQGYRLLVATSKARIFAEKILDHLGIAHHFAGIYGSGLDGTLSGKDALLAHILARESVPSDRALMIGDRKYDVLGAAGNGISAIGVLWGFGTAEELQRAGALGLCRRPEDLVDALASYRSHARKGESA